MSIFCRNLSTTSASIKPKAPRRIFTISPAINGTSSFDLDNTTSLNIGTYGTWTLTPLDNFNINVKMWGAGGRTVTTSVTVNGGAGGYSAGTMSLSIGNSYILVVGQGGNTGSVYTHGGGGYSRKSPSQAGGLSGIFVSSYQQSNARIIAGGGGNACRYLDNYYHGGGGGGVYGANGSGGEAGLQGRDYFYNNGTVGVAGDGTALSGGLGDTGARAGYPTAAGGGGYFGGGGGGDDGGGGGGSGYIHVSIMNGTTAASATNNGVPPNSSDTDRGIAGQGGTGSYGLNGAGADGRIVIR